VWRLLAGRLDVPEPVSPAQLRRVTLYGAGAAVTAMVLNGLTRFVLPADARVAGYDRFLALNLPLLAACAACLYASAWRPEGAGSARLARAGIALLGVSVPTGTWLVGGPAMGLNLILAVVVCGVARLYLTWRDALLFMLACSGTDLLLGALWSTGVIGPETALPMPELAAGGRVVAAALLWRVVAMYLAFVTASYAADRFRTSEHKLGVANAELLQVNRELEERVTAQVTEIVSRAQEAEALSLQLQERVRDRANELARALRRLGGRDDGLLSPGQELAGRFEIELALGSGAMGVVYRCHDRVSRQTVAVKLIRPGAPVAQEVLRRFFAEAAAAASVRHPGIVKTLDVDVAESGMVYLVMEYVSGHTLAQRLARGPLEPAQAARIFASVAGALAAAHAVGIVHRDVKPSNVMLTRAAPGVRVLDFGLAKLLEPDLATGAIASTAADRILGTPRFMSPEQIRDSASVGAATDVYSLGVSLFCAIAGRPPFDAPTVAALCIAHLGERPPELAALVPDLPPELGELVRLCLEKEALRRPSAALVAEKLQEIADALGEEPAEGIAASDSTLTDPQPG